MKPPPLVRLSLLASALILDSSCRTRSRGRTLTFNQRARPELTQLISVAAEYEKKRGQDFLSGDDPALLSVDALAARALSYGDEDLTTVMSDAYFVGDGSDLSDAEPTPEGKKQTTGLLIGIGSALVAGSALAYVLLNPEARAAVGRAAKKLRKTEQGAAPAGQRALADPTPPNLQAEAQRLQDKLTQIQQNLESASQKIANLEVQIHTESQQLLQKQRQQLEDYLQIDYAHKHEVKQSDKVENDIVTRSYTISLAPNKTAILSLVMKKEKTTLSTKYMLQSLNVIGPNGEEISHVFADGNSSQNQNTDLSEFQRKLKIYGLEIVDNFRAEAFRDHNFSRNKVIGMISVELVNLTSTRWVWKASDLPKTQFPAPPPGLATDIASAQVRLLATQFAVFNNLYPQHPPLQISDFYDTDGNARIPDGFTSTVETPDNATRNQDLDNFFYSKDQPSLTGRQVLESMVQRGKGVSPTMLESLQQEAKKQLQSSGLPALRQQRPTLQNQLKNATKEVSQLSQQVESLTKKGLSLTSQDPIAAAREFLAALLAAEQSLAARP